MDINKLEEKLTEIEEKFKELDAPEYQEWLVETFSEIQSDYKWYEARAKNHHLKMLEVNEALRNATKSVKSNNEHVRKLKGKINEVIERWFQQK